MSLEILSQKAVRASLDGDWKGAITLNEDILKLDKNNINALNRLAKIYIELKKTKEAKKIAKRVLKLDPINEIAKKNLKRADKFSHTEGITSPESLIKEPGKTKTISLESKLPPRELLHLEPGEILKLKPYRHKVKILDLAGHEIARIEDETASTLLSILKKKIPLRVNLINLEGKKLTLLIKGKKEIFPPETKKPDYRSYTTPIDEEPPYETPTIADD